MSRAVLWYVPDGWSQAEADRYQERLDGICARALKLPLRAAMPVRARESRSDVLERDAAELLVRPAASAPPARIAALFDKPEAGDLVYCLVDASDVPDERRHAAASAIKFACLDLGVKVPLTLQWFAPSTGADDAPVFQSDEIGGMAILQHNTIGLNATNETGFMVEAGAHEIHHIARGSDEDAAYPYGRAVRDLLVSRHSRQVVDIHEFDRCPLKTQLGAGIAAEDDIAIAPDTGGDGLAVYRNWGGRSRTEWMHCADLPLGAA